MLILLGAAGGALRGLLDAYTRFLDWQSARRDHRQLPVGQVSEPPRFQDYFDPVADPVAAVVHSAMGAGAAVLLGTTGQVSGAYAAVVVGISAPVILTQLGRAQSVGEAVTGAPQPGLEPGEAPSDAAVEPALPAQRPPQSASGPQVSRAAPFVAAGPTPSVPPTPAAADSPHANVLSTNNLQPESGASEPPSSRGPAHLEREQGSGFGTYGPPHRQHGPAIGEEGAPR
ncbi:hypothetical protein [Streptomyces griseorubiginosus]|uniref:hypothetical protein n=1 Tax=Streptomyces griseorubiginosus TaxID=67304 RepID=UPI0036E3E5E2